MIAAAMLAAAPAPAADVNELDYPPGMVGGYAFDHVIMISGRFERGDTDIIRYREDITDGLENAPAAFIGMLEGRLVRVAPPA
jgi:hypothetical protein